mmetsp:Transcript_58105/g.142034  ORF Transcript_58105/g.142034 Transcript_58105/m.142034 type:complete len:162 (+) Transcript_58105:2304-2789(+)
MDRSGIWRTMMNRGRKRQYGKAMYERDIVNGTIARTISEYHRIYLLERQLNDVSIAVPWESLGSTVWSRRLESFGDNRNSVLMHPVQTDLFRFYCFACCTLLPLYCCPSVVEDLMITVFRSIVQTSYSTDNELLDCAGATLSVQSMIAFAIMETKQLFHHS